MTSDRHLIIHFGTAPTAARPQFDAVLAQLTSWPYCHGEPDGSFVWRAADVTHWRVYGQLHDGRGGLASLELRGTCAADGWEQLLELLGGDASRMQFQRLPDGTFVDGDTARQFMDPASV